MPRPRMSTDIHEWLASRDTSGKVKAAADNCREWLTYYETRSEMDLAYREKQHWQWSERLRLLQTKALLMGIQLEE